MSLFAKIENGIVTDVIVASQDVIDSGMFGTGWIETWTEAVDNPRKTYAGIGYTYDSIRDAFIPPKIFDSWLLDEESCCWVPPKNMPASTETTHWIWDETTTDWVAIAALN